MEKRKEGIADQASISQEHPFLQQDEGRDVDMVGWIAGALAYVSSLLPFDARSLVRR